MVYVHGVDVSNYNGAFDWAAHKGTIGFGFAKATEGVGWSDAYFNYNWKSMKDLGIYRWAYHFAHPGADPNIQAQRFVEVVSAQGLETGDNFALDLEVTDGMSASHIDGWAYEFCKEVQKLVHGHRVIVYTYPYFAQTNVLVSSHDRYLWIANYGVAHPVVPAPWTDWMFWQYFAPQYATPNSCDLNVFNGDEARLKAFCTTTGKFTG